MAQARELNDDELHLAAAALLELRPAWGDTHGLVERVREQRAAGYRVAAAFEDGDPDAAAVAGFRLGENLAWGRYVYVDDLVTRESLRGRGHAEAVMRWVEEEARRLGCDGVHLDSGVGTNRQPAHRFYFRHGMRISSYHFHKPF